MTSFVRNLGNQRFLASFVPHEPVQHKIDMQFNNEPVIGKSALLTQVLEKGRIRAPHWMIFEKLFFLMKEKFLE